MARYLTKGLEWFGWVLLGLLILTVSFVMRGNKHGWEFDAVLSGSMEPGIHVGGLVVIKPVDVKTLKVGDVISFKVPSISTDTPICHRIVSIQYQSGMEYFQTKGDANKSADPNLTAASNVNGKKIFYAPYVGRIADAKNVGANHISLLGVSLPLAVVIVVVMGLLFVGLIFKDTIESILWPGKQWQREAVKKRNERLAKRRKTFYL